MQLSAAPRESDDRVGQMQRAERFRRGEPQVPERFRRAFDERTLLPLDVANNCSQKPR